jgi:hypothetical protein
VGNQLLGIAKHLAPQPACLNGIATIAGQIHAHLVFIMLGDSGSDQLLLCMNKCLPSARFGTFNNVLPYVAITRRLLHHSKTASSNHLVRSCHSASARWSAAGFVTLRRTFDSNPGDAFQPSG